MYSYTYCVKGVNTVNNYIHKTLKGHKLDIFVARVFTQIRPIWDGDLGTKPKNSKSPFCPFSAVAYIANNLLMIR